MTDLNTAWGPVVTPVHQSVPGLDEVGLPWRDNAVFFLWDVEREVYGQIHMSTSPNGSGRRARCAIAVGDRAYDFNEPLEPGTFNSESITVDLEGRIVVTHDRLQMDLRFTPRLRALDWSSIGAIPPMRPELALNHHEHGFAADGKINIGGQDQTFAGTGWRDRTWGYRNENAQWVEYIYLASVFEDFAVVLWKVLGADGAKREFGWKVTADAVHEVTGFEFSRDGASRFLEARIQLPGERLVIEQAPKTTPFDGWWLPMSGRQDGPAFGEFDQFMAVQSSNGQRGGGVAAQGNLRTLH